MIERLKHIPSTIFGSCLICLGAYIGLKSSQWEAPILLITAGLSFVGYKPKVGKNE